MSRKYDNERDLEQFLADEGSSLSALYRKLPPAEPDGKLDAVVVSLAHRAVNPPLIAMPRRALTKPPRRAWIVGFGSAAGLVLAAGIAWQLRTTIEHDTAPAAMDSDVSTRDIVIVGTIEPQKSPTTEPVPTAPIVEANEVFAQASPGRTDKEALAKRAPPKTKRQQDEAFTHARRGEYGVTEYTLPSGAAGPPPRPAPAAKPASAQPFPADADRLDNKREKTDMPAAAEQREAEATLPLAASSSVERKAELATGSNRADALADMAPEPPAVATPSSKLMQSTSPTAPSRSAALARNARLEPKAWIALIQQLVRDGRDVEARENLSLFRRKHPRLPLPDDLAKFAAPPP